MKIIVLIPSDKDKEKYTLNEFDDEDKALEFIKQSEGCIADFKIYNTYEVELSFKYRRIN